jgi:hypothetical protein
MSSFFTIFSQSILGNAVGPSKAGFCTISNGRVHQITRGLAVTLWCSREKGNERHDLRPRPPTSFDQRPIFSAGKPWSGHSPLTPTLSPFHGRGGSGVRPLAKGAKSGDLLLHVLRDFQYTRGRWGLLRSSHHGGVPPSLGLFGRFPARIHPLRISTENYA